MTNDQLADHFDLLGKLMEIHGENSFKIKSYTTAAYTIEKLPKEIADMTGDELEQVRGIGQAIQEKIHVLLQTGKLPQLEKLVAATPPGIIDMLGIKGLGPKKIAIIWKELGIETVGELEYACAENRLSALKGFGAKTQDNILKAITFYQQSQGFHLWAAADAGATEVVAALGKAFPNNKFSPTGDLRRQHETLEAIELVSDVVGVDAAGFFGQLPEAVITEEPDNRLLVVVPGQPAIRLHLTTREAFYHTLFLTTGSAEFVGAFMESYALPPTPESEEMIFEANGLAFVPPALRETKAVLEKAKEGKLPELITGKDIKGIIHSHSTWSDGADTIEAMAKGAMAKGFEYLVMSDHSQAAFYANGLKPDRILAQHEEIDALNMKLAPFKIFKSIEADILHDGSLDYEDAVLRSFDLVIASVHSNLKMSLEKAMDRILTAVRNPFTTILGHPTGRLLLSREGYPVDHRQLIDACAAHDVVIEINAHPRRLDIDWRWIEYALEKGVLLSIDPDSHSVGGFKDVHYGAMIGQKGGLTAANNLSSFSLVAFEAFLREHRKW